MNEEKLKKGYTAYRLTDHAQSMLLGHIDPVHPEVIAHHVTHEYGVYEQLPPGNVVSVRVTHVAQNDVVQAAVVKVDGSTQRPDGRTYHVTISVDRDAGGEPAMSNALLADPSTWVPVDPFTIAVMPEFFPL